MERKRVKVYKPGGMTNNISLYQFQVGGPTDMASNDTSAQLQQLVMTYAQVTGLGEQEAQQLMQSLLQMPADQQQQAVQQMTSELNQTASQNTMARFGGDMKNTKRLLKKAIGGALSGGESSDNVIDARKQTISNVLGANMARNIVDQAAKDSLNAGGVQPSQQQVMQPISGSDIARYGGPLHMAQTGEQVSFSGAEPVMTYEDYYNQQAQAAQQAYDQNLQQIAAEQARVDKVRGNVIPTAKKLDAADNSMMTGEWWGTPEGKAYAAFLDAENPKQLQAARQNLTPAVKALLPNQGGYNVARWDAKEGAWNEQATPGRELYCTPYGCFTYQKAGATDVPTIGGNVDFAQKASAGTIPFEKIAANERQPGDMALWVEMAPADYTDPSKGYVRRPHHTTVYAGPDPKEPNNPEAGNYYNANNGVRLKYGMINYETDLEPADRMDYYRYVGGLPGLTAQTDALKLANEAAQAQVERMQTIPMMQPLPARVIENQLPEEQIQFQVQPIEEESSKKGTKKRKSFSANKLARGKRFDIGGQWEDPFYTENRQGAIMGSQDFANRRQGALDATRSFLGDLRGLASNIGTETVIKRKGDIFERPEMFTQQGTSSETTNAAPNTGFFQQDADENQMPDYLQQNYAQWYNSDLIGKKNGGSYIMYQPGGTFDPNIGYSTELADAKNKYAQYNISDYTGLMNLYNQGKLPMSDFYNVADAFGITIPANAVPSGSSSTNANPTVTTNTSNPTTTNTNNTSGGYTGQVGPYYFKDGVNMGAIADLQGTGVNGYNYSNILQGGAGRFGMPGTTREFMTNLANPANMQAFGNAISGFQPEGVFLDKFKGRVGPFGAKLKMTWEYGPDGKPVQVPTVDKGSNAEKGSDSTDRLGNPMDWMRNARARRDAKMSEEKFAAKNARRAKRRGWDDESTSTASSNELSTGVSTPTGGSGIGSMEREEGPYGPASTATTPTKNSSVPMSDVNSSMVFGPDDFMETEQPTSTTQSTPQAANTQPQSQAQVFGPENKQGMVGSMFEMPRQFSYQQPRSEYELFNDDQGMVQSGTYDREGTLVDESLVYSSPTPASAYYDEQAANDWFEKRKANNLRIYGKPQAEDLRGLTPYDKQKFFINEDLYNQSAGYIALDENGNEVSVPVSSNGRYAASPQWRNNLEAAESRRSVDWDYDAPAVVQFAPQTDNIKSYQAIPGKVFTNKDKYTDTSYDWERSRYDAGGGTRGKEGSSAGKLIMKDRLTAPGMSLAGALMTGMNALSSWKEQPKFNENMYMPDAWHQVLKDSRTANPMSRGVNPVGPLRGMQIPDIKPLDEGRRWTNGSGNLLSGQTPYSGYSKMGGNTYEMGGDINDYYYNDIDTDMYQLGGTYELDQDEIDEIISNGGTVQYI